MKYAPYILMLGILSMKTAHCAIVVIRHGESTHNVEKRYNSNPQHPNYTPSHLTPHGIAKLKETAAQLLALGINKDTVKAVYVSPLPRTIQTADVLKEMNVFSPEKIYIEPRLIEVQMGDREGHFYKTFHEDPWDHTHAPEYHGETDAHVKERMQHWRDEVIQKYTDGYVLCITHGTPALELISLYGGNPPKPETAGFTLLK